VHEVAPGVHLLRGFPPAAFNVYAIKSGERWMLVDTSTRYARRRILRQLPGELEAIFITHAHRDHAGSMHAVATATGAPVWGPELDADALEGKVPPPANEAHRDHIVNRTFAGLWKEFHPVARRLREGETVAGLPVEHPTP
jgi:glyoxylase-like metal-dependent hydrolase (beta-lactamase superfamily II)